MFRENTFRLKPNYCTGKFLRQTLISQVWYWHSSTTVFLHASCQWPLEAGVVVGDISNQPDGPPENSEPFRNYILLLLELHVLGKKKNHECLLTLSRTDLKFFCQSFARIPQTHLTHSNSFTLCPLTQGEMIWHFRDSTTPYWNGWKYSVSRRNASPVPSAWAEVNRLLQVFGTWVGEWVNTVRNVPGKAWTEEMWNS